MPGVQQLAQVALVEQAIVGLEDLLGLPLRLGAIVEAAAVELVQLARPGHLQRVQVELPGAHAGQAQRVFEGLAVLAQAPLIAEPIEGHADHDRQLGRRHARLGPQLHREVAGGDAQQPPAVASGGEQRPGVHLEQGDHRRGAQLFDLDLIAGVQQPGHQLGEIEGPGGALLHLDQAGLGLLAFPLLHQAQGQHRGQHVSRLRLARPRALQPGEGEALPPHRRFPPGHLGRAG